eukprot:gnl/MRDRNA2_/MRDRNA2_83855_c0_seq1.p1 gnl/MRDRNA2_/MRDRNA2_83855_c0~~gnl/MRDRNA2_/MRDRNA2_83855_c0_seq1.p1  ORF type:complete len:1203 (+),score=200.96 gnl/MRDRNA2_/MRDRNA2_83855_c0_seq1:102-3710(+)
MPGSLGRAMPATLHFLAVSICTATTELDNFFFTAASSSVPSYCSGSYDMSRFDTASASQCAEYCNAQPACQHFKVCTDNTGLCCKLSSTCRTYTTAGTDADGYLKKDPDYPYRYYASGNLLLGQTATAFDTRNDYYPSYVTDGQHQLFKDQYESYPISFYQAQSSTGWIKIPLAIWASEVSYVENLIVKVFTRCDNNRASRNVGLQIFTQNPSTNAWEACGSKATTDDLVCVTSDPTKSYWMRECDNQAIAIKIQGDGTSIRWAIPEIEAFGNITNTTTSTTSTTVTTTTSSIVTTTATATTTTTSMITTTASMITTTTSATLTSTVTSATTTSTINATDSNLPCTDTDNGAKDADGDTCSMYDSSWCGTFDDKDFSAATMCCICGGGSRTAGTTTTSTTTTIRSWKETHAEGHGEGKGTVTAAPSPQPSSTPSQAITKSTIATSSTTTKLTTSPTIIFSDPRDAGREQDDDNDRNDDDGSAAPTPIVAEDVVLKVNSEGREVVERVKEDAITRAEVNGPPAHSTLESDEGQVHIAVQKASKSVVEESGIIVTIVEAGGASAELPGEVALSLEPGESAACTMVAAPNLAFFVNESSKDVVLGSAPVQIELKAVTADNKSRVLKVEELKEPIQIMLNASGGKPPQPQMQLVCVAWDEDSKSWSDKGLTTRGAPATDGALACESTHLTIFAAVWKEATMAILCSNLNLFNEKTVQKLIGKTGNKQRAWYEHKVGAVYFALCLFALCSPALAYYADCTSKYPPNLRRLFINAKPPEKTEEELAEEQKSKGISFDMVKGWVEDNAKAFGKSLVFKGISKSVGVCADDLAMLDALNDEAQGQADDMVGELEDQQEEIKEALDFIIHHGVFLRLARVMRYTHPVIGLTRSSVALPRTVRTLMFVCKLWCAMLVAALFFQTSGEAVSVEDPEECAKAEGVPLVRAIVVGCFAAFVSEFIAYIEKLYPTTLKYIEGWSDKKVARQLLIWKVRYCAFIIIALCYLIFCMLFVGLFLASVTDIDKDTFVTSTVSQLTQQWFVVPLAVTLLISVVFIFVKDGNRLDQWIKTKFNLIEDTEQAQAETDADGLTQRWEVRKDPLTDEVVYYNTQTHTVRSSRPEVAPGFTEKVFVADGGEKIIEIFTKSTNDSAGSSPVSTKIQPRPLKLTQVLPEPEGQPPEMAPSPPKGLFGTLRHIQRTLSFKSNKGQQRPG